MSALWLWHPGGPREVCLGWTDVPFDGDTKQDAQDLQSRIRKADAIWTSDLKRDRQAARPLARALGLRLQVTPALRARHHGEWDGLPWAEVRRRWPSEYDAYVGAWHEAVPPGGESYQTLRQRVLDWWAAEEVGGHMVVVGHGAPLRALAGHLLGWSTADEMAVTLARGHCAVLDRTGRRGPGWNFPPRPGNDPHQD